MKFSRERLEGVFTVDLEPHRDDRGSFARVFCLREFESIGHTKPFVQINHSINDKRATLRGLHFQVPPFSEIKLIRCIRGAVYDVVVDIRAGSPTFLQHFGTELTETNQRMIYVPEGFAHGFVTLQDNTQLIYHHTAYYTPGHEGGLRYDDPDLAIEWPVEPEVLTDRDRSFPLIGAGFSGI